MNLTFATFLPLLPIILLSLTAVVVMLGIAVKRHHGISCWLTLIGLAAALVSIISLDGLSADRVATPVTTLLLLDGFAYFYSALIIVAGMACAVFAYNFLQSYGNNKEEIYLLLLIALVGGLVLVSSNHMASFFIGLELLSVPVYGMVAYIHERNRSLEAGIKYLVLSAAASAFMLFGMALVYAQTGTLYFEELSTALPGDGMYLAGFGVAMIAIALCFKLSLAPFHLWTPDVYQGAPAPVGALLATVSKVAVIAVLVRFIVKANPELTFFLQPVLTAIALVSIVVGNLLALRQKSLKRLLAYSSIAHLGYLLIALVAGNSIAVESVNIYMLAYVITSLGVFGVISAVSHGGEQDDHDQLTQYHGLFWRNPALAVSMTLMMLSLAGIPLSVGFIGKFYIFMTAVDMESWILLGALIIGSGLGLYYYLRVMLALYLGSSADRTLGNSHVGRASGFVVILMAILVVVFGVYPQPALELIQQLP